MRALLALALLLAAGCGEAPEAVLTGNTAGFAWAVLPPDAGSQLPSETDTYFRADAGDVRAALAGIRAALQRQMTVVFDPKEADTNIWREMVTKVIENVPTYRCQVMGMLAEDKRRYLYLNFVHEEEFRSNEEAGPEYAEDWTTMPYVVDGGGHWFWQVRYYPATGTFEEMSINGDS